MGLLHKSGEGTLHESSMMVWAYEQLGTNNVQDHELVVLQRSTEATGVANDLVLSRYGLESASDRQAREAAVFQ